jgi:hypothetical protein
MRGFTAWRSTGGSFVAHPVLERVMVITDDFVYLHMPKTGGTFVEAALNRLYSPPRGLRGRVGLARRRAVYIDTSRKRDRRKIGGRDQHQTLRELPAEYRDRPVAFTVRNPFDHWVSYYEFGWWRTNPGDTFNELRIRERYPHYPEISFDEYLSACYAPDLLDPTSMPDALADRLTAAAVGPLSWEYVRFLSERPEDVLDDPHHFFLGAHSIGTSVELRLLRQESLKQGAVRISAVDRAQRAVRELHSRHGPGLSAGWSAATVAGVGALLHARPSTARQRSGSVSLLRLSGVPLVPGSRGAVGEAGRAPAGTDPETWEVVRRHFGDHNVPCTLLGVAVLGYPDQLVEVEAVAAIR